jgi:ribonuclease R
MAEGLVHVSSLNDDWYEYRSRQSRLVGRKSKKVYQLGDNIKVKIMKVDILRNQIDLEVCEQECQDINNIDSNLKPDKTNEIEENTEE